ncbi:MAG: polysaccharide biosynthesis C-terminal domain-containing protein [Owenweeksia sp.]|nr:polysaccharide biosynthesis C-terminal domain-containing protein [Owenweeksia sp.]
MSLSGFYSAPAIMGFLYDEHSALSTPVFQLLVVSSIAFGSTYVFGTLLTARGNLRTLNKVALAGFLLNVILNLLLIPHFGATGAATATVATQFLTAIVQVLLSFRLARFHFKMIFWLRMVGYLVVALVVSWGLQHTGLYWAYLFVLNLAVVVLIAFVFKLLHIRAAIELIGHRLR